MTVTIRTPRSINTPSQRRLSSGNRCGRTTLSLAGSSASESPEDDRVFTLHHRRPSTSLPSTSTTTSQEPSEFLLNPETYSAFYTPVLNTSDILTSNTISLQDDDPLPNDKKCMRKPDCSVKMDTPTDADSSNGSTDSLWSDYGTFIVDTGDSPTYSARTASRAGSSTSMVQARRSFFDSIFAS
ncbi:hypothetical protein ADEAN_000103600 [Angomonas deanei]|uniref:Uncharacterized protein n=1 Tax=Angomonas deanei TaxID=59799 RepID=A0A7G2C4D2_9TRYP|nr:hypothetical protein ADEAN_000103600 [Angomonas deanei]